jgi:hypothetical protein
MAEPTPIPVPPQHSHRLLFVIDGEIVSVMNTDERMAAVFMSSPKVIQYFPEMGDAKIGYKWNSLTEKIEPVSE